MFRILTYLGPEACLESCLYRHILEYLGIANNNIDNYNNIHFLFFTLIFHTFQQNLKRCFLTTVTSISMLE